MVPVRSGRGSWETGRTQVPRQRRTRPSRPSSHFPWWDVWGRERFRKFLPRLTGVEKELFQPSGPLGYSEKVGDFVRTEVERFSNGRRSELGVGLRRSFGKGYVRRTCRERDLGRSWDGP